MPEAASRAEAAGPDRPERDAPSGADADGATLAVSRSSGTSTKLTSDLPAAGSHLPDAEPNLTTVVLAGGFSRRMGVPKAFLRIGERELLDVALNAGAALGPVVLVVREAEDVEAALARYGWRPGQESRGGSEVAARSRRGAPLRVTAYERRGATLRLVQDRRPGAGPLTGIETGFSLVEAGAGWVLGCDFPFLLPAIGLRLNELLRVPPEENATMLRPAAVVPRVGNRPQGLCAVYDRRAGAVAAGCLDAGERSVRAFLRRLDVRWAESEEFADLGPPERLFFHVNRPEDLVEAREWAEREF